MNYPAALVSDPRREVIQQLRQLIRSHIREERPIDCLRIRVIQHLEWQLCRETVERLHIQKSEILVIGQVLPTDVDYSEFVMLCKQAGFRYLGWGEERWASIYPIESLESLTKVTPETASSEPHMLASMWDLTGQYPTDPVSDALDSVLQGRGILDEKKHVVMEKIQKLLDEKN